MRCQKDKFDLDQEVSYLNGAYMSPLLRSAIEAGYSGVDMKRRPYEISIPDFFDPAEQLKAQYAEILNILNPHQIALTPSVSYGLANAANNIHIPKGKNKIIVLEEQFPSNYYIWADLAKKHDLRIETVGPTEPANRGATWNQNILSAIDDSTLLVAMCHAHWADGTLFDLVAIGERCRAHDALLIIDGTQSFGALPYDQAEVQADIIAAAGYKWLMGPYALGFCYFSEAFLDGHPIEMSWINRKDSQDFKNLVNYKTEYRSGAQRYEMGEAANFINIPIALAGTTQILEWGVDQIQSYSTELLTPYLDRLIELGLIIEDSQYRTDHLFGIRIPDDSMSLIQQRCEEADIKVSYRGDAIRVSLHVYNEPKDLDKLYEVLSSVYA